MADDGDIAAAAAASDAGNARPFATKYKRTLDSDEEDDEQVLRKYGVLHPDAIQGQEDDDVRSHVEARVTPFNLKDEQEEGYFDADGMFIFHKREQVSDNWLDNIDWVAVEDRPPAASVDVTATDAEPAPVFDLHTCYRDMLSFLHPGESVQQAIRRLGRASSSKSGKRKESAVADSEKQHMLRLISLADQLIGSGDMDAYERTYEQLSFRLGSAGVDANKCLDMFDKEEACQREEAEARPDDVSWQLRWSDSDDAPVHGPFSNQQMMQWREAGYFAAPAFVRQVGRQGSFHSVQRVDFDLYS